jgi:threonylcarbamoyladenosine tRNA methylthiotransferase MtaB
VSIDVVTFGCRLNTYESEVIRRAAGTAGLNDAVVVNTCAVTAEAVRQARQSIRRIRRERPGAWSPAARRKPKPHALPPCPRSIA